MTIQEKSYYEILQSLLIGRKIKNVYYEALDYQNDTEYWNISDFCHSIDMSVILELDDAKLIQMKWDDTFYSYGIGIELLDKLNYREGIKTQKVTENSSWSELLNRTLVEIIVYWDECQSSPTNFLPQSWELKFENDAAFWISVLEINEDAAPSYWADHLTVFFSDQEQEKYNLKKSSAQYSLEKQ